MKTPTLPPWERPDEEVVLDWVTGVIVELVVGVIAAASPRLSGLKRNIG